jgi:hypothetical protein
MPRSRIAAPGLFLWGHVIARRQAPAHLFHRGRRIAGERARP